MASSNIETFCGGTFSFYVGPEKVRFILYKNLVARFSKPLEKMMSNGMKESQEGQAFLEHVDVGTFGRFAEYIHAGDYSAAAPVEAVRELDEYNSEPAADPSALEKYLAADDYPKSDDEAPAEEPAPPPPEPEIADGDWGGWTAMPPRTKKNGKKEKMYNLLERPGLAKVPVPQHFPVDPTPGPNTNSSTSYTPAFASHIAVHHFAEHYLVPGLKQFSGRKLSDALNVFHCYHECVVDICDTVRLIYTLENEIPYPSFLHETISEYATNNFRTLTNSGQFKRLLTEGGQFPADLCSKVARRL